jgi:hypothetical protein
VTIKTPWSKGNQSPSTSAQDTHGSRLRWTGEDRRAGSSNQATDRIPNPRIRIPHRPPSPSSEPLAYWPMKPSNPAISLRGHRETTCDIHSSGPCPYPVALRSSVLSSLSPREGEEGVAAAEGVVEVVVAEEDDDDESIKVIPVPASPPRLAYKQMTQIRIGPRGLPTGTLAPRTGAREAGRISPQTRSEVWPPPLPPPPLIVAMTPPPPPPLQ